MEIDLDDGVLRLSLILFLFLITTGAVIDAFRMLIP